MSYKAFEDFETQRKDKTLKKRVQKCERRKLRKEQCPTVFCGNFSFPHRKVVPDLKRKNLKQATVVCLGQLSNAVVGLKPVPSQFPIPKQEIFKNSAAFIKPKTFSAPPASVQIFSKKINVKRKRRHHGKRNQLVFNGKRNVALEKSLPKEKPFTVSVKPTKLISNEPGARRKQQQWNAESLMHKYINHKVKTRKTRRCSGKTENVNVLCFLQIVIACQLLMKNKEHQSMKDEDCATNCEIECESIEATLPIFINDDGITNIFYISKESKVRYLREKILKKTAGTSMYYNREILQDDHKLSDYYIKSYGTIYVDSLLKGGAPVLQQKKPGSSISSKSNASTNLNNQQKYSNLNLNNGHKAINIFSCQSHSQSTLYASTASSSKKFHCDPESSLDYEEKRNSQGLNGSYMCSRSSTLGITSSLNRDDEKATRKQWKSNKHSYNTNSSTLSLHITAYENSTNENSNTSSEKCLTFKKEIPDLVKTRDAYKYEFPRQQKEIQHNDPEVMQFKASQKLLNPNSEIEGPVQKKMRTTVVHANTSFVEDAEVMNEVDMETISSADVETIANTSFNSSADHLHPSFADLNVSRSTSTTEQTHTCYFAVPRKSVYESEERNPEWMVSVGCEGSLTRFEELLHADAQGYPGCSVAQLILIRGGSEFDIDLSNVHVRTQIAKRVVCKKHEKELGLDWSQNKYNHILRRSTYKQHTRVPVCSMPNGFGEKHNNSVRPFKVTHALTIEGSKAMLHNSGKFIPPGTPLCDKDRIYVAQLISKTRKANTPEPVNTDFDYEFESHNDNPGSFEDDDLNNSQTRAAKVDATSKLHKLYEEDEQDGEPSASNKSVNNEIDEHLLALAEAAGIVVAKERKNIESLCHDSQQRKVKALKDFVNIIAERIAPSDPDKLLELFARSISKPQKTTKAEQQIETLLTFVKEQYKVAETGRERIAVLSQVVAVVSYSTLLQFIPNLTPHYFKAARFEAYRRLEAWTPPVQQQIRTRYNHEFISIFIQFITSSAIMVGLPYGSRVAKLPDGRTFDIPNTIRKQRDSEVIKMFYHWLQQIGRNDVKISETVLRKILKTCAAHRQHSLYCVDYYEANGKTAFDNLFRCLETMSQEHWIDDIMEKEIKILLQETKLYLNTDYSLHVQEYSNVPEHCINFALSDSKNSQFRAQRCEDLEDHPHSHDHECDRCVLFGRALKMMYSIIEDLLAEDDETTTDKLHEIQEEIKISENDVLQWKWHILRATFSELQRLKIIEGLKNNEALIYLDYAQKFLPRYYLERQKDYYGKKGLCWHIAHIDAIINNRRVQHTLIHLLSFEEQNAKAVSAIIKDILKKCKLWQIEKVVFRSDNAGYYRNAAILQTIPHLSIAAGVEAKRWSFSEVQAGKNPSDRAGARMKAKTKDYQDCGNNILSSDDMFEALLSGVEPLSGLTVVNGLLNDETKSAVAAFPGISLISDVLFDYDTKTMRLWKHYGKGEGQSIPFADESLEVTIEIKDETMETPENDSYEFWRTSIELVPKKKKQKSAEARTESDLQSDEEEGEGNTGREVVDAENSTLNVPFNAPFCCPEDNCVKRFRLFNNLERHIEKGNHKLVPEKKTLYDDALNLFVSKLEQVDQQRTEVLLSRAFENFGIRHEADVKEGFCLREFAKKKRFSAEVHAYIDAQLEVCIRQQKRLDAQDCEKAMAAARLSNGKLLFSPSERLTASQIASLVKRKLDKMGNNQKQTLNKTQQIRQREEIDEEIELETGEVEIEYQDHPLFQTTFDAVHEMAEQMDEVMPVNEAQKQPIKRRCRKK